MQQTGMVNGHNAPKIAKRITQKNETQVEKGLTSGVMERLVMDVVVAVRKDPNRRRWVCDQYYGRVCEMG